MSPSGSRPPGESDESTADAPHGSPQSRKEKAPGESGGWAQALRDIAPYLDLGWRLAGAAAFPPLIGALVDVQFQTTPWGVFVGAGVGLVGAGLQLRRLQQEFRS